MEPYERIKNNNFKMKIQGSLSKSNTCFGTLPYSSWATLAIWLNPRALQKLQGI